MTTNSTSGSDSKERTQKMYNTFCTNVDGTLSQIQRRHEIMMAQWLDRKFCGKNYAIILYLKVNYVIFEYIFKSFEYT